MLFELSLSRMRSFLDTVKNAHFKIKFLVTILYFKVDVFYN
jgi:hypothetical protein